MDLYSSLITLAAVVELIVIVFAYTRLDYVRWERDVYKVGVARLEDEKQFHLQTIKDFREELRQSQGLNQAMNGKRSSRTMWGD